MGGWINDLVPELQPFASALVDAGGGAGLQPRITSTLRTHSEQRRLYAGYLAGQAGYPVAPPGQSSHEYGEAFDLVVSPMAALRDVGRLWRRWGGGWSGRDAVHFELPGAAKRAQQHPADVADPHGVLFRVTSLLASFAVKWDVGLAVTALKLLSPGLYRELEDYTSSVLGISAAEWLDQTLTLF